jgi:hypothetical protein
MPAYEAHLSCRPGFEHEALPLADHAHILAKAHSCGVDNISEFTAYGPTRLRLIMHPTIPKPYKQKHGQS